MKTCLVLVTHNRLYYTRKCVEHVLDDVESDFDLYIWDNASSDDTPNYLKSLRDNRIKGVIMSEKNYGPMTAMNKIWGATQADFVSKIDNDCLVTSGWLRKLTDAHRDCDKLGAVACWHFRPEDFNLDLAKHKVQEYNGHRIFQHPWVCGSGFVMKKQTYLEMGPWEEGSPNIGTTGYFLKLALKGYLNGWLYPFVLQHHMDDIFSPYRHSSDNISLQEVKSITYSLRTNNINTIEQLLKRREHVLKVLHCSSRHARDHVGWRGRLGRYMPMIDRWRQAIENLIFRSE